MTDDAKQEREAVARALCAAANHDFDNENDPLRSSNGCDDGQAYWLAQADAAIAALRQPQTDDNEDFGDTVLDFGVELLFAVIGLETQPYGTTAVFEVELRGRTRKVTVTCAKL